MRSESVIEWRKPARFGREMLVCELQKKLPQKVMQAFLFGSYARNEAHEDSDIDLMLIIETTARWHRRALAFEELLEDLGPLDVLVYTPAEWTQLQKSPTAFFAEARSGWIRVR